MHVARAPDRQGQGGLSHRPAAGASPLIALAPLACVLTSPSACHTQLIFSGRVLKNEDPLTKYGVKNGVAIHLVSVSEPAAARVPVPLADRSCAASYWLGYSTEPKCVTQVKGARPAGAAAAASTTPAARGPSEAAGVPSNFAAGQQVMGNPLAPLMNAQYAGALGG